jgi:cytochrome c
MNTKLLIAAAALMLGMSGALAQDVDAGATTFKVCTPCHDVGETAKNKIGPLLNGLEGRKTGTVTGYNYSDSNKNSGIVWDEAAFLEYIKNPKADIPGTKMVFVGLKDEAQAKNLWAYLKQFGPDGKKK